MRNLKKNERFLRLYSDYRIKSIKALDDWEKKRFNIKP